jgi:hypothetical protein
MQLPVNKSNASRPVKTQNYQHMVLCVCVCQQMEAGGWGGGHAANIRGGEKTAYIVLNICLKAHVITILFPS